MAFRGGAKSTLAEEVVIVEACFGDFNFAVLLGESRDRAIERLRAIKYELEFNDDINFLFGSMRGPTWNEDEIVLSNNRRIMAFGMEQSLRGVKDVQHRPDRLYADDMESDESVTTPEARKKFSHKFLSVALPMLDPKARIRVLGTPLDREAFMVRLMRLPEWNPQKFPIEFINANGEREATWPARFPLEKIDALKSSYAQLGSLNIFAQEFMLEVEDVTQKRFTPAMFRYEPIVRTWQPTIAVYDPARTVNTRTSATTGHVVASWIGNKLVVWEADGRFLLPNEIVDDIFRVQEQYHPIKIGVEADGLNEFIMQPVRHAQVQRRELVPIVSLKAPKGKLSFIESLQPFFKAGEIVFAKQMPELQQQLESFPTGRVDAPNALAYFLVLRPGLPIYDGFSAANVVDGHMGFMRAPSYLCVNSSGVNFTAVLVQHVDGVLRIIADWAREGDAAAFSDVVQEARLLTPSFTTIIPAKHFKGYDTTGLVAAATRAQVRTTQGGSEAQGQTELRVKFKQVSRGMPCVQVSAEATWTLNALAGGYCRAVAKHGELAQFAEEGVYRTLCEGLESFTALLQSLPDEDRDDRHYAYTDRGVRYMTALPRGRNG